jgi:hypothetical protein
MFLEDSPAVSHNFFFKKGSANNTARPLPPPKKKLPLKIQGDSHSFDIAESKHENQIALSPTNIKGERIKLKATFVIKK